MGSDAFVAVQQCRICGNPALDSVLSLGTQFLTGVFPRTRAQKVSAAPLELVKCRESEDGGSCGLLQLRHAFNPDEIYRGAYGYRSGINHTMTLHLQQIVEENLKWVTLHAGDVVLDIGSNDATLLKAYPHADVSLVGIDPSGENFRRFYPEYVELVVDYFSTKVFRAIAGQRKAKIVTSIAMFYDLPAPVSFMRDIKEILAEDGVWVLEQSYMPRMIEMNAYDTICHEHLEYYGLRQIKWMVDRVGLKILDVDVNDTNGGSFRVVVAHEDSALTSRSDRWREMLDDEEREGFATLARYQAFKESVSRHRDELSRLVATIHARGETLIGYGASTKGNVILQFCGLTEKEIPAIAERNPEKYGCFTPGTLIPIITETEARERRPDYLLVLPWHFRGEILRREAAFLAGGGKLLFPLPHIEACGR
jgi:cyclopropane fatty-acyl-phospholipid synthase-like methyltransferase